MDKKQVDKAIAKRVREQRNEAFETALEYLSNMWRAYTPGLVETTAPDLTWWAEAAPPWVTLVRRDTNTILKPVHPLKWLRRYGVDFRRVPTARSHEDTKRRFELGQEFYALVKARCAEEPTEFEQFQACFDLMRATTALGQYDVAVDTETTGLNPYTDRLVGFSFASAAGAGYFTATPKLLDLLVQVCKGARRVIGFNAKFDQTFFDQAGVDVTFTDDVKLIAWILGLGVKLHLPTGGEEGRAPGLKELADKLLAKRSLNFADLLAAWGTDQFEEVPWLARELYGRHDAEWTLDLFTMLWPKMSEVPTDLPIYKRELALIPSIQEMESGWRIDMQELGRLRRDNYRKLRTNRKLLDRVYHLSAGANLAEVRERVYSQPGVTPRYFTEVGKLPSTALPALRELDTPLTRRLVERAEATSLETKFFNPLFEGGREWPERYKIIHPTFRSYGTNSGRPSSNNPNFLQIAYEIKTAFVADQDDHVFVCADYGQIELRIAAVQTGDPLMIEILSDPTRSLHNEVKTMLNLSEKRYAKNFNFGGIFGAEEGAIALQCGLPPAVIRPYLQAYKEKFYVLQTERKREIARIRRLGYAQSYVDKFRRYLPGLYSRDPSQKAEAERQGYNHVVQGGCADIAKRLLRDLRAALIRRGHLPRVAEIRLRGFVYDEVLFSVPRELAEWFCDLLTGMADTGVLSPVPIIIEPHIGRTWAEAKGVD